MKFCIILVITVFSFDASAQEYYDFSGNDENSLKRKFMLNTHIGYTVGSFSYNSTSTSFGGSLEYCITELFSLGIAGYKSGGYAGGGIFGKINYRPGEGKFVLYGSGGPFYNTEKNPFEVQQGTTFFIDVGFKYFFHQNIGLQINAISVVNGSASIGGGLTFKF